MMVSAENDPRRHGTIWVLHVDQEMPAVAPRLRAEFSRLTPDLAPALASSTNSLSLTEITKRIESGRQCHVARVDGQIAAYGWVSFVEEDIGELNLRIKLLAGEAYIWDCATLPAYRRQRLYSALLAYMLDELSAEGLRRIWIGTDVDNVASQKGVGLAGFRPIIDIGTTSTGAGHSIWVRKRAGVSEQDALDARQMLQGHLEVRYCSGTSCG